jgi:hypothetical protein
MPNKGRKRGAAGVARAGPSQHQKSGRAEFSPRDTRDHPSEPDDDTSIPDAESDGELSDTQIKETIIAAASWLEGGVMSNARHVVAALLRVVEYIATATEPAPPRVGHTEAEILKRLERIEEKLQSKNEGAVAPVPVARRTYAQVVGATAAPVSAVRSRELTVHLKAEPETLIRARSNKDTVQAVNIALGKGAGEAVIARYLPSGD